MLEPLKAPKQKVELLFSVFYLTGMLVWFAIGYLTCVKIVYSSSQALEKLIRN
jgi:hypothetical protein